MNMVANIGYTCIINKDVMSVFQVYCDQETEGGGWIVFQRRKDGSVDFYRDWNDYKIGFGNALGEFWLGLDYLHDLTATGSHELWIDMEDFEQGASYAKYSTFKVGPESEKYVLTATDYSGNAGDALNLHHNGRPFSTKDADNDASGSHCAKSFGGGWWYGGCHNANLNGLYLGGAHKSYANGINWGPWKGHHYSLKFVEMKFREKTTQ